MHIRNHWPLPLLHAVPLWLSLQLFVLVPLGCRTSGPPRPPGPLPRVSAAVPQHGPLYVDHSVESGARVVATCRGCETFWETTRGDWVYTWAVARFDVLAVERGTWDDLTLSFICWDAWPTLESGIMVNKPPWPYRKGVTLAFDLDPTQTPARVVGQVVREDPYRAPATQPVPIAR